MKVILVTGMLASGKSIALRIFQDLGYYCVDNLPPSLIRSFIELTKKSEPQIHKVALVVDARGEAFFNELENAMSYLKAETNFEILFIDAMDEILIQRYKLMRRRHLMAENERIEETILRERKMLQSLREKADYIIDTSYLKDNQLKMKLLSIFSGNDTSKKLMINIVSFGFKYGILKDGDLIFDVRFLPNPYYNENLKFLTGLNEKVQDYVLGFDESVEFINRLYKLIEFLIPFYFKEGKSQLIVGIGCSGGRHRSVVIAEELAKKFMKEDLIISIEHRDINKDEYV